MTVALGPRVFIARSSTLAAFTAVIQVFVRAVAALNTPHAYATSDLVELKQFSVTTYISALAETVRTCIDSSTSCIAPSCSLLL